MLRGCIVLFSLFLLNQSSWAQQTGYLFGAHNNGIQNLFSALGITSQSTQSVSTLSDSLVFVQGESTYNALNRVYYIKSNKGTLAIDAYTGTLTDTLSGVNSFNGLEFDSSCTCLLGVQFTGTLALFSSFHVGTKTLTILDTLHGVSSTSPGESTYDPFGHNYYIKTNLGILKISSTGIVLDTLQPPANFGGIEYNPLTHKIYGTYWNGSQQVFASYNNSTDTIDYMGQLIGAIGMVQGETTFDKQQGYYFCKSINGIFMVDAQNGITLNKFPVIDNFGAIEFGRLEPLNLTGINKNEGKAPPLLYPNPGSGSFFLKNVEQGSLVELYDLLGRVVLSAFTTDPVSIFQLQKKGVYIYKIHSSEREWHGKLIVE